MGVVPVDQVKSMDYGFAGLPFCSFAQNSTVSITPMDYGYLGVPFVVNYSITAITTISELPTETIQIICPFSAFNTTGQMTESITIESVFSNVLLVAELLESISVLDNYSAINAVISWSESYALSDDIHGFNTVIIIPSEDIAINDVHDLHMVFDKILEEKTRPKPRPVKIRTVTKYVPEITEGRWSVKYAPIIRAMVAKGLTNSDVAEALGVELRTVYRWKEEHIEAKTAFDEGNAIRLERCEKSLFEVANGYEMKATYFAMYKGQIVSEEYIKKYPPNVPALLKILSTLDKQKWGDVSGNSVTQTLNIINNSMNYENLSIDELKLAEKLGLQSIKREMTENGE